MSRPCTFPSVTSVFLACFCASYLQLPVVHSRSIDVFKVQHSIAVSGKPALSTFSTDPAAGVDDVQRSRAMSEIVLNRRLHMSLRARSSVIPKFVSNRGRKMLFGARGCASQDLTLIQGPVSSTSGIPTFSVQIINLCGNCALGAIHVACGNWASATPVDPYIFTRLAYNDCLVNNGKPLMSQGSISFQYSNSAMYPMSIVSANNECNNP